MAVSTIADDKKKALNLAIAQIEKSCGKGSIMRMDEKEKVRVEAVPTGAINLDAAIGVGGIPRGRGAFGRKCEPRAAQGTDLDLISCESRSARQSRELSGRPSRPAADPGREVPLTRTQ